MAVRQAARNITTGTGEPSSNPDEARYQEEARVG